MLVGLLGFQGSSVGIYGVAFGETEQQAGVVSGSPRVIRADEWLIRTPWVLWQEGKNLPTRPEVGMGRHDVNLIVDLPTRSWVMLARPHLIPYLLFDGARALALEWSAWLTLAFVGPYLLLYVLTKRVGISAVASALLVLSPGAQWWTIPATFTIIGYGCSAAALFLAALRRPDRRWAVALAASSGWAFAAFLTSVYVPWQIGVGLCLAPVVVLSSIAHARKHHDRAAAYRRIGLVGAVAVGFALVIVIAFAIQFWDGIRTIANTEYPGGRTSVDGGGVGLARVLSAPLDAFAASTEVTTVNSTNQSENASVVMLLVPVSIVTFGLAASRGLSKRAGPALIGALIGGGILAGWLLLPLPAWAGGFLLLNRVPPARLLLPLGLASVLAFGTLLGELDEVGRRLRPLIVLTATGVTAAALFWSAGAYRVDGQPINLWTATLFIAIVTAGIALSLTTARRVGLSVLLLFALWQASLINPIQHGISALTNNELTYSVEKIRPQLVDNAAWVGFGIDMYVRGALMETGVNSLSTVSLYPDEDSWRVLDPTEDHKSIWNRYASLYWSPGPAGSLPGFELLSPDAVAVTIDPCDSRLDSLNVEVFITQDIQMDASCADLVDEFSLGPRHLRIYRRALTSADRTPRS
jgi:hypothetical protein